MMVCGVDAEKGLMLVCVVMWCIVIGVGGVRWWRIGWASGCWGLKGYQ